MSEKNNPLEGIMDLINQYSKEDVSKLVLESAKDKLSSLLNEDSIKGLLSSQNKGSLENIGAMANMMNVLPMVEKVVNQRMDKKSTDSNKHDVCKKDHKSEIECVKELLEDILDELKKIKYCTCPKKHCFYKDNWEHWY